MARHSLRRCLLLLAAFLLCGEGLSTRLVADDATSVPGQEAFASDVGPFLKRNCLLCHQQKNPTAGLDLSAFPDAAKAWRHPEVWEKVAARITDGTMPPKGLPQPPMEERQVVLRWIHEGLASLARNTRPDPGRVTARRLNRTEYNNTIRDLLGVDFQPAASFPADDAGYGFDNIGDVLSVSPLLMEKYLYAAWDICQHAIVSPHDRLDATVARLSADRLPRLGKRAQDRSTASLPLNFPRAREGVYEFPAEAEYEILVRVSDRRRQRITPGLIAVSVAGAAPQSFETQLPSEGEDAPNEFAIRTRIPAGNQPIRLATVDANMQETLYHFGEDPGRIIDVSYVEIRGPFGQAKRAIHDAHRAIFTCNPASKEEQPACAATILSSIARRAYRRPVTPRDLEPHLRLAAEARAEGFPFEEQIRFALQSVLVSPHFLFRIEVDREPGADPTTTVADSAEIRTLSDIELASRLSYFLWSSMPDETLLQAAEEGRLRTRDQVLAQASRMLADPRSRALTENFAGQWLGLRNMDHVQPDRDLFPEFDNGLRHAMKRETELVFEALLREGGTVDDLLTGSFTYLNERLARHYEIDGIEGDDFQRVSLANTRRSGILTHASVLTVSSYPTRTSPVLRGLWLLENIIGAPPPPPPPDVPELDADGVGEAATLRERMERHRLDPTCAACHDKMDPLGFGLENFDAIGRYRTSEGRFPIDASGTLPDGSKFDGPDSLKQALLAQRRTIAASVAEKMLTFALGRGLERYDRAAVEELVDAMRTNGYRMSTLVEEICWSMPFRMRRMETREASQQAGRLNRWAGPHARAFRASKKVNVGNTDPSGGSLR